MDFDSNRRNTTQHEKLNITLTHKPVLVADLYVQLVEVVVFVLIVAPYANFTVHLGHDQERPPTPALLRLQYVTEYVVACSTVTIIFEHKKLQLYKV